MYFAIVTFNEREAAAIEDLFNKLVALVFGWNRLGPDGVERTVGSRHLLFRHHPLNSQGNVVAATCLAEFFTEANDQPDFVLFYGCAGVTDVNHIGNVYLVAQVTYASLGTVTPNPLGGEVITLKNKWLCHTTPKEVEPLQGVVFPNMIGTGAIDLVNRTGFPAAHVVATDKVIKISPSTIPPSHYTSGPPHPTYKKDEWSYGEALSYTQQHSNLPLLVEMESYGIGMLAHALKIENRTIIVRVTTDSLSDHTGSDQQQADLLLKFNRAVLAVIIEIVEQAWGTRP